jgi:hypothetical protein
MPKPPKSPKIYHITHVSNLSTITSENKLFSDAAMARRSGPPQSIGMDKIKLRRLQELTVDCHAGDYVGEYVPFYFCPRSVMLYLLYMGNHPDITYKGGQGHIVHLEADLEAVVEWANRKGRKWAFSLSNAGARYTQFRNDLADLDDLDWTAILNNDFRSPDVKEGKQAEFLLHESFPWKLIERIGVYSNATAQRVAGAMSSDRHLPVIEIKRDWYF